MWYLHVYLLYYYCVIDINIQILKINICQCKFKKKLNTLHNLVYNYAITDD